MPDWIPPEQAADALRWLALIALPLLLVSATSFVKMSVVFAALRNALGAPDLPSTLVITALAFVLSVVVMAPVVADIEAAVAAPAAAAQSRGDAPDVAALWERASEPMQRFFSANSDADERALFLELGQKRDASIEADGMRVLWPAFVLTELKEAFQMALLVVLPFFVIDLVLANVLLALGMTQISAAVIGLPLKLLLLVSVDAFSVLSRALVGGYS